MLDDWKLDPKGLIDPNFARPPMRRALAEIGALLTVNAAPAPRTHEFAPGARVRLRLANLGQQPGSWCSLSEAC